MGKGGYPDKVKFCKDWKFIEILFDKDLLELHSYAKNQVVTFYVPCNRYVGKICKDVKSLTFD